MLYENQIIENLKLENEPIEDSEFIECSFVNCVFENCSLNKCSFISCKFTKCNIISIKCKYSQLKFAEFIKCNLIGVHWLNLLPAGRIAEPIKSLSDCFLKYNTFVRMELMRFDFSGNAIQESAFEECNLKESNFKGIPLESTQFSSCDMRNADFRESIGYRIDITTNKLKGAKFSFPDVISLLNVLEIKID